MNNAQTWMEINQETIGILEDLEYDFLQILLAPPLLWDCGKLKMDNADETDFCALS